MTIKAQETYATHNVVEPETKDLDQVRGTIRVGMRKEC